MILGNNKLSILQKFIIDNMGWFILLIVIMIASFTVPGFLSLVNFTNILGQVSVLGIVVAGLTICLITGNKDLSIEGTVTFVPVVAGWLMTSQYNSSGWNMNPYIVIGIMLLIGVIIGLINGVLVTKVGLDPFIVTLAMLLILRGLSLVISKSQSYYNLPKEFTILGTAKILGVPIMIIIWIFIYIIVYFLLDKLKFGRVRYAIGGNKWAALACGMNVDRIIINSFILSSVSGVFGSLILVGKFKAIPPLMGNYITFDALAAAVIGGVSLRGGKGSIIGALSGVLLLGTINNVLNLSNVPNQWVYFSRGLLIFLAVIIDALKNRIKHL
jgi:simple sugar transport system permease protein/ribose transport system permease protein